MSILEVRDLQYYFQDGENRRYVLNNLNCEFEKGKLYSIVGQSGSGKTTFLSLLGGLDFPSKGSISYNGTVLNKKNILAYRRNSVSTVFQDFHLIPYMTAVENLLVPMGLTDNKLPENKKTVALNLLDHLGISDLKANRVVTKLSGGEKQRVAIARAISTEVDIIVADEPTGNLDNETAKEIVSIFKEIAKESNKCIIIVTHSQEVANEADVVLSLMKGEIVSK